MKNLAIVVLLGFAAYAAGANINCFQCKTNVVDSVVGGITMSNPCLAMANDANTTVQTATCPDTSKCYTKIRTVAQYAFSVERGCWDNYDDKDGAANCDAKEDSGCNGILKTGTCFKCCNTNRCNKNFAQLSGVKNGVSGSHVMSVLALLPVALAMLL
ncbi:Hypp7188 [Branchiostoma lanceolatum]|uniref:Hypp7188 protein n=1 Tax=Branchiostoma lanceolatum TaxID=7740 RepID=A0A8J9YYH1_BRALA|nr:Hypp7188 [Branchiostoma lanceolatum]